METLELSVPFNGDPGLIPLLTALNTRDDVRIREVFLSGPIEYCSSGRVAYNGDLDSFSELVERLHREGFRVDLIMNSTCEGVEWYSDKYLSYMQDFISYMVDDLGIEAITLANPIIMSQVRQWAPEVELCASVLGDVDCVERAKVFERAGANTVTPDVSINRDLAMLRRIKDETSLELKVMVNEGCLHKCPMRKFHFNAISHIQRDSSRVGKDISVQQFKELCDQVAGNFFFSNCNGILAEEHGQILKSGWIRPEDLDAYEGITSFFKISGRTVASRAVERMVRAYMDRSYEGDLLDIMDSSLRVFSMTRGASLDNKALDEFDFFNRVTTCDRNCTACGFCDEVAKRLVKTGELSDTKRGDQVFAA